MGKDLTFLQLIATLTIFPPMRILLAFIALLALSTPMTAPPAMAAEPVTLQLKWTHAFQFAGYYAAKELGYYQQAGLDVTFKEANPGLDVVDQVLSGKAQYGVGTSSLLLARNAGKPVVALAVIFQHSPQVLITGKQTDTQSIHDLNGKRIMMEPLSEELQAYMMREGVRLETIRQQEHSFNPQDLVAGKTDAISAYVTSEPYFLLRAGFDYLTYTPRSVGIDFYGDNLFTSERELEQHPERAKAFRAASLRGWQYAMAHQEEIISLIYNKYSQRHSKDYYEFEAAQMTSLVRTDLVPVGFMNPGRWRHIADIYAELGMLPAHFPLAGFLYQPDPQSNSTWLYSFLLTALGIAIALAVLAFYIYRINRRLKQSMAAVEQAESRLQVLSKAIDQSPTSVLITGADTVIEYVNPYFSKLTGYTLEEAIGKTPKILQASGLTDRATYRQMWGSLLRGEAWTGELANRRKSGEIYWEEVHVAPVKDSEGKTTHYVGVKLDITDRKQTQSRLTQMAHYDVLTNLPNRTLFFERVTQGLALARRNKNKLALMFIDLDKFKPINDTYGHAVGDLVLQEAARRMATCLRDSDTIGRIGGDEFVVLLPDVDSEDSAAMVADKIRMALNQPFEVDGSTLSISSSIGVALYAEHGGNEIELAKNADFAMYQAKASGRDNVKVFQAGMLGAGATQTAPAAEADSQPA
jgi:diguanylate cyclase (GGDEF)-like protein/PAS domain S-box-containing protein